MKRPIKTLLAALACACLLAGCALPWSGSSEPDPSGTPPAATATAAPTATPTAAPADAPPSAALMADPLTGAAREAAATRRPYAVTFYNTAAARPQWALDQASVVAECLTEGNTTWLMGFYPGDAELPKVGPVGPARDTLLQLAMGANAIPIHIGQNNYAWNLLNQYGYQDINGWYVGVSVFDLDWDRNATVSDEQCWYTRQATLNNGLTSTGVALEGARSFFHFAAQAAAPANAAASQSLTIQYAEGAASHFDWDAAAGNYLLNLVGAGETPATLELRFDNLLVLYCRAGVKDDGYTRDYDLTEGVGLYLTRGGWQTIQWQKGEPTAPLYLYDEAGEPVPVNPGRTYLGIYGGFAGQSVQLTADGAAVTLPAAPEPLPTPTPSPTPAPTATPAPTPEATPEATPAESQPTA